MVLVPEKEAQGAMMDMDLVIANNIIAILKQQDKKQIDLASGIGVSKQTMSKMLNGGRAINAVELKQIADYLNVSTDLIVRIPEKTIDTDVMHTFMGRVETEEAREALRIADKVSDMILFHRRVREKGIAMMQPAEV